MTKDEDAPFCILGAGSSGLAAARHLKAGGIPFECLEREDDVGGNWYYGKPASSVYASTHTISSKRLTEYRDFPLPESYPEFPSHRQIHAYLRDYARHHDLYRSIEFNAEVRWMAPDGRGWTVELASGDLRRYRGVIISNGHNWDPRWPDYPGNFDGLVLHSSQYKTPEVLRDRRVLVVGGGNSGCDLAVEAAVHGRHALHSTRRGYHVLPKFFRGKPIDQCGEVLLWMRMPLPVRRLAGAAVSRLVLGPSARTGMRPADHRLFETHPVINSQIHHHLGHGRLELRGDIEQLLGDRVRFVDGQEDAVDLILYATGFKISFPFMDPAHLNLVDGAPQLYLNVFHPRRDDVFCIGLIQPDSGQFGLVDDQAAVVARYIKGLKAGRRSAVRFQRIKQGPPPDLSGRIRYVDSPRHRLEVEHASYRRRLGRLKRRLR